MKRIGHWIDGRPVAGISSRQSPVFNPATGEHTKETRGKASRAGTAKLTHTS